MYRKFTKLYMFLLVALIVIGGTGIFFSKEPSEDDLAGLEEEAADKTPGYATMTALSQIVERHIPEAPVLDIQVSPQGDREEALLLLQTTEFSTEDALLENTFILLQDIRRIDALSSFTITWCILDGEERKDVMTLALDREGLDRIQAIDYSRLPSIAADYYKHGSFQ